MTDQDLADGTRATLIIQSLVNTGVVKLSGWAVNVPECVKVLDELKSRGILPDEEKAGKLAIAITLQLGFTLTGPSLRAETVH